jgi:hypothetical protein
MAGATSAANQESGPDLGWSRDYFYMEERESHGEDLEALRIVPGLQAASPAIGSWKY